MDSIQKAKYNRMLDTLHKIAMLYPSLSQLQATQEIHNYVPALELSYESIRSQAAKAIRGVPRID